MPKYLANIVTFQITLRKKSPIRSYSGSHFAIFGLPNAEKHGLE